MASTVNVVSCAASPICSSLYRSGCFTTPNTCGGCFDGFIGIYFSQLNYVILRFDNSIIQILYSSFLLLFRYSGVIGDSNTKCLNGTTSLIPGTGGKVGSRCTTASNCLFNYCANNVCSAPLLLCPSSVIGNMTIFCFHFFVIVCFEFF